MKNERIKNVFTTNETTIAIARMTTTSRTKARREAPRLLGGVEVTGKVYEAQ
jgi:hypothetical protein